MLPLIKKKHAQEAKRLYNKLSNYMMVQYEETGSIGKRYRRGDAIGIPFAVTVDDDTLEKGIVTVRNRDTMEQESRLFIICITEINHYFVCVIIVLKK